MSNLVIFHIKNNNIPINQIKNLLIKIFKTKKNLHIL